MDEIKVKSEGEGNKFKQKVKKQQDATFLEKKEFTLNLIQLVKERPVIFDNINMCDVRTKVNKDKAWCEIAEILEQSDVLGIKKHWKNIRDRYVKVKNARKRHFESGGIASNAPTYCFYEQLDFMKDFSSNKKYDFSQQYRETSEQDPLNGDLLEVKVQEPSTLLYTEISSSLNPDIEYFDYTTSFIDEVKKHPILYDNALRFDSCFKQKTAKAWTAIANALNNKFTKATLKNYWNNLVMKFKSRSTASEQGNAIFQLMEDFEPFLRNEVLKIEQEELNDQSVNAFVPEFLDYSNLGENTQPSSLTSEIVEDHLEDNNRLEFVITENANPPVTKQYKRSHDSFINSDHNSPKKSRFANFSETYPEIPKSSTVLDEFDYFGKKVACQLRSIAQKSKPEARAAEIRCLEILMLTEQKLDANS